MSLVQGQFHHTSSAFTLDVQFAFAGMGVTALFGPSGCGKTTFLRLMAGLDMCTEGELLVSGRAWQTTDSFLPPHLRSLGYVFQNGQLFEHLNVQQNLQFGFDRTPKSERRIQLQQAVELLQLQPYLHRSPRQLSGGQKQRVAMGMAILRSPQLLLMDEPLSGLDEVSKSEILPFISQLAHEVKIPIIYVSHSLDEVVRLADDLVLMDEGRFVVHGSLSQVLTDFAHPLALCENAGSLVQAQVKSYDQQNHLLCLGFPGGEFLTPGNELPLGEQVRLRIMARDVSLTLNQPDSSTILNVLPAKLMEMREYGTAQTMVKLHLGKQLSSPASPANPLRLWICSQT